MRTASGSSSSAVSLLPVATNSANIAAVSLPNVAAISPISAVILLPVATLDSNKNEARSIKILDGKVVPGFLGRARNSSMYT